MRIKNYECNLIDDGTLDTRVEVEGIDFVYDQEFANTWRNKDTGELYFERFCKEVVIPDYVLDYVNE